MIRSKVDGRRHNEFETGEYIVVVTRTDNHSMSGTDQHVYVTTNQALAVETAANFMTYGFYHEGASYSLQDNSLENVALHRYTGNLPELNIFFADEAVRLEDHV